MSETPSTPSKTVPTLNPVPLTPEDVEVLRQNKGWFENGYDNRDAEKVLECFTAADLAVTWEYLDDGDHAGCSEFIGMESVIVGYHDNGLSRRESVGPWRRIHPDVWTYLSDPDTDIDPEQIPSLLDTGEHAVFEDQDIADKGFIQNEDDDDDEDECYHCGESLDDGNGYDGYCGDCADRIEGHNTGNHRPVGERNDDGDEANGFQSDCPNCLGAGIVWS